MIKIHNLHPPNTSLGNAKEWAFFMYTREVREKTNKIQQLDVYYQYFLNMFHAPLYPSSGEQDVCYCTWCAALVLMDVVGSGCGALRFRVRAL